MGVIWSWFVIVPFLVAGFARALAAHRARKGEDEMALAALVCEERLLVSIDSVDAPRPGDLAGPSVTVSSVVERLRLVLVLEPGASPGRSDSAELLGERQAQPIEGAGYREAGGAQRFVPLELAWASRERRLSPLALYGTWTLFVLVVMSSAFAVDCNSERALADHGVHASAMVQSKPYHGMGLDRYGDFRGFRYDLALTVDGVSRTLEDVGETRFKGVEIGSTLRVVYLPEAPVVAREGALPFVGVAFSMVLGVVSLLVARSASAVRGLFIKTARCLSFTEA